MSTFKFENTNSTILYIIGALGGDCVLGGECLRHPQGQCIFHCYAWFGGKLTQKIPKVPLNHISALIYIANSQENINIKICRTLIIKLMRLSSYGQTRSHFNRLDEHLYPCVPNSSDSVWV